MNHNHRKRPCEHPPPPHRVREFSITPERCQCLAPGTSSRNQAEDSGHTTEVELQVSKFLQLYYILQILLWWCGVNNNEGKMTLFWWKLKTQIQWAELYSKYCLNFIVFIIQRAAHASLKLHFLSTFHCFFSGQFECLSVFTGTHSRIWAIWVFADIEAQPFLWPKSPQKMSIQGLKM